MSRRIIVILLLSFFSVTMHAQFVEQGGRLVTSQNVSQQPDSLQKKNVRILTIGIGDFDGYAKLESCKILADFKYAKYILKNKINYDNFEHINLMGKVKAEDVCIALDSLEKKVSVTDLVIIPILSHGEFYDKEYYLICSDTKNDSLQNSAIPGSDLRRYFESMANKGAAVLVFLDTCHAATIFEGIEFTPESDHGLIAYYAASKSEESGKEIMGQTRFSKTISEIFNNAAPKSNLREFVTLNNIEKTIEEGLNQENQGERQTLVPRYYKKDTTNVKNFNIFHVPEKYNIFEHPEVFSPFAVSKEKKGVDYSLITLEAASALSFLCCGLVQEQCKSKINSSIGDIETSNSYKVKGKNAAIGCCISAAVFAASYGAKVFHVYHQNKKSIEGRNGKQSKSLSVAPSVFPDYNGLALVYKF